MLRPSISLTHGTLASRVVSLPQPNDPHAIDGYDLSHRIGVHAEGPICSACVGHLIHPNNGSHTPLFEPCFKAVDAVCASGDADSFSFCRAMAADDEPHSMMHVIEVSSTPR